MVLCSWPSYGILIIGGWGSGKTIVSVIELNKNQRPDIDEICLPIKDPFKWKYQLFLTEEKK